ncbi:unnamed protein product, partial [Brassica napus]
IKFQELGFDWASRLVHYMLEFENLTGLNCEYIEDLERPHCVVIKDLTSLWGMLGVHVEAGPSTQEIITAFERCEGWFRNDRKRLAYLAIFTGHIEGRKYSTPTRVWVYTALPELCANYGNPLPNNPSPPILAYKGRKCRRFFKETILKDIKTMFKDIVDAMREWFGTCLKEIKYLSERVEAVEKKVGITTKRKGTLSQNTTSPPKPTIGPGSESVNGTNAGRKSLPEDKGPYVPADASSSKDKVPEPSLEKRDAALTLCRAKSDRIRKLAASQQSPYTANSTAKGIIPNKNLYPGYNPFAPIDKKKLKKLADWLKTCPHYRTPLDKKSRTSRTWWYHILRISLEWLEDCHIDAWINVLRKRMCFLDHLFALQWRFNYKDFKDSEPDQNSLGRRLPVNYTNSHWIAMWISIPKRHIVVWDSICSSISLEELDVARAGDCGVYALKYIECHALGMPFSKKDFAKPNGKTMRDKMAVDIFKELPDAYELENKDNDANLGAYEG